MRSIFLLPVCAAAALGQPAPPSYPSMEAFTAWSQGNYLAPLIEFREKREALTALKTDDAERAKRSGYLQQYASYSAAIGNYRDALEAFDEAYPPPKQNERAAEEADGSLKGFAPVNAKKHVLALAAKKRAVFINKAHRVPQHRAFTISLLKELRRLGYRYFAAETLMEDADFMKRGYPALGRTGFHTNEPFYGELVRTALRLGFQVVAYEHAMTESGENMLPAGFQKNRDRGQAANLAERVFQKDPNAKLVVHAGYSHIHEKETPYWSPMAMYFRQLTGIDPVTVDQTEMSERSAPEREAAEYRLAESRWRFATPVVLRNAKGRVYVGGAASGMVDVQVFSPRSAVQGARPE